ncbi:MAG: toprim domain-containing protein [Alphaproteobacteria bacterium]
MSAASEMAQRLAREAEAVCRHYLPHGRREGRYWRVGDVHGTPGESLYVRLHGTAAGRWADAATGEHGDLLDLIGLNRGLGRLAEVLDEARVFLGSPRAPPELRWQPPAPIGSPEAARRLFARSRPLAGTLAEAYLRNRGIPDVRTLGCLRFQPRCWYRDAGDRLAEGPALIAAVTGLDGRLTGVQRTWLDPSGGGKAAMPSPRRALGHLLGNGVRFGVARDILAAGEGVETMLALRTALPALPMVAALSAGHLAALRLPPTLRRLYVARDNDAAGRRAADRLGCRAEALGIEALVLAPVLGDLNDDVLAFGQAALRAHLRAQLAPEDVARFWMGGGWPWGA